MTRERYQAGAANTWHDSDVYDVTRPDDPICICATHAEATHVVALLNGLNLAATQYSESRDRKAAELSEAQKLIGTMRDEFARMMRERDEAQARADAMRAVCKAAQEWEASEAACFAAPLDNDAHEAADEAIDSLRAAVAALRALEAGDA